MPAEIIRSGSHLHATVSLWTSAPRLPYAERLVTFLIVDRDALRVSQPVWKTVVNQKV